MPRGPSILLNPKKVTLLTSRDPSHPLLRRHLAASKCIHHVLQTLICDEEKPYTRACVPSVLSDTVSHLNNNYLLLPTDLKLNHVVMWQLLFRSKFLPRNKIILRKKPLSHEAIYIQLRHDSISEKKLGRQKRKKALCPNELGQDYSHIRNVTTVVQKGCRNIIYATPNLHAKWHGSVDVSNLFHRDIVLDFLGIKHYEINLKTVGKNGITQMNNVVVAFPHSQHLLQLEKKLHSGGVFRFHHELTQHLLLGGVLDVVRMNGRINDNEDAYNIRLRFGYTRCQADSNRNTWYIGTNKMPTLSVHSFIEMSTSLKDQFMKCVESCQVFVNKHFHNSFPDANRNHQCAGRLNSAIGYPNSKAKFEYYDIILSRNTILRRHCDTKNDHRPGYNHCVVYSFFHSIDGRQYRVSIVMTTRSTIGCAYENAMLG